MRALVLASTPGRILQAARLDPVALQDPDARIPIEQVDALWRKAYELSNDPNLALHAIEVLPFGAYRVIDFLASSAPTIGAALAKVSDYFPLINGVVRLPYAVAERDVYDIDRRRSTDPISDGRPLAGHARHGAHDAEATRLRRRGSRDARARHRRRTIAIVLLSGPVSFRSFAAAAVLSRENRVRRKSIESNRRNGTPCRVLGGWREC